MGHKVHSKHTTTVTSTPIKKSTPPPASPNTTPPVLLPKTPNPMLQSIIMPIDSSNGSTVNTTA